MSVVGKILRTGGRLIGRIAPINKRKIVFCSYHGRGYSDNPKAIAEELLRRKTDADMVWLVKDEKEAATLPEGIRPCKYGSLRHILELSTAKVWVDNCRKYDKHKKKKQFYLHTWHGFSVKRVEADAEHVLEPGYVMCAKRDSSFIDLLTVYGEWDCEIYKKCFWYDGDIAVWGVPRNDVFINNDGSAKKKVAKELSLPEDRHLLLYAPTFRADHNLDVYDIDVAAIKAACEKSLSGEWTVLLRLHPNIAQKSKELFPYDGVNIVDATMYPDMQELLLASDILLTDYSSSMFDFAMSGKPCFIYAPDVEAYKADRNFYIELHELPFPLAYDREQLIKNMESFDAKKYKADREQFFRERGFVMDGKSSARCADWIEERLG